MRLSPVPNFSYSYRVMLLMELLVYKQKDQSLITGAGYQVQLLLIVDTDHKELIKS